MEAHIIDIEKVITYINDEKDLDMMDWLRQYTDSTDDTFIRGFLGRMLFSGEEALKKISVLSGQTGAGKSTFINSLRIAAACEILQYTDKKIAEVAQAVSFPPYSIA